jgi:uncharacterized membrane protein
MNKAKWLLKEIDSWQHEGLVDAQTAEGLKRRYALKKNVGYMSALFPILGTLLIGGGVIMMLAKNWQHFPLSVRVAFKRNFFVVLPLAYSAII